MLLIIFVIVAYCIVSKRNEEAELESEGCSACKGVIPEEFDVDRCQCCGRML